MVHCIILFLEYLYLWLYERDRKSDKTHSAHQKQNATSVCKFKTRSRAVARKPRDAAAVLFGLKFNDNIYYKFQSSHASFESQAQNRIYAKLPFKVNRSFKVKCYLSQCKGNKRLNNTKY